MLNLFVNLFMHLFSYSTYIPVHKTNNQVTSGRTTFLRSKVILVFDEESKKLRNFTGPLYIISTPQKPDL